MTRVKRGTTAHKRRQNIVKQAKGFKWGRKSKYKLAKDALRHAWTYAYRDRKVKKRDFRRLWQIKINAAVRQQGLTYSRFIEALKKANIKLDRKILATLAEKQPKIFAKITEKAKGLIK
ncbi:MAG: 50S ribosomal protein L20 [Patescibacteria group bacterium]|nr:50S ribosomal protein L20 [Patescibacteria group bacterium]